jgi:hypothetical protein
LTLASFKNERSQHFPGGGGLPCKSSNNNTGFLRAIWLHRLAYGINLNVQNDGEAPGTKVGKRIPYPMVRRTSLLTFSYQTPQVAAVLGILDFSFRRTGVLRQRGADTGQMQQAEITISNYDISYWGAVCQGLKKPDKVGVRILRDSRKIGLRGSVCCPKSRPRK